MEDPRFQGNYWLDMWDYYEKGGKQHIAAYLRQRDISKFDPKAPPPKTPTFWLIVNSGRSSEEAELADALDGLGNPDAVTLSDVTERLLGKSAAKGNARIPGAPFNMNGQDTAKLEFAFWLRDRKNRRVIPHRFEGCGYVPVRNPDAKDGQWKIGGSRQTVYAKDDLSVRDQIGAARCLTSLTP